MKITNNFGLPEPLVKALSVDNYSKGESDMSTTQLPQPSRIFALQQQYGDQIVIDASDLIYRVLGQSIHLLLERLAQDDKYIVERRFFKKVAGITISGQIDLYIKEEFHIHDWKLCATSADGKELKDEWISQANVNRWLMADAGLDVYRATYVALYRDWIKIKASLNPNYPQVGVGQFQIPLWPQENTEPYVTERIKSHQSALAKLPECTAKERWASPEQWAVMPKDKRKKRAIKLHKSEDEAKQHADNMPGTWIEYRPEDIGMRCRLYCECAPFCEQYKRLRQA